MIKQKSKKAAVPGRSLHGRIFLPPDQDKYLDSVQLDQLEQSFRAWSDATKRPDVRNSRRRILLIFLLIRFTGAKLNEVLSLDPDRDIDFERMSVFLGRFRREVQISEKLCDEARLIFNNCLSKRTKKDFLSVDSGFVRRKFYERAEACGISKQLGAPEILRKSRAIELMRNNMPLPAVQLILGHSTPNLTSSYVSFSEEDIQKVARQFVERESAPKTSARNAFFGKIRTILKGDIQTCIEMVTTGGYRIHTVITNGSLQRLGLKTGKLITAEVKAPLVMLHKDGKGEECSADNMLKGVVEKITPGRINTEYTVRLSDGTQVCAIVTTESCRRLALAEGHDAWVLFSSYSVVLMSDQEGLV